MSRMTVTLQKCYEFPTGRAEPIPEAIVHQLTYSKGLWVRCVKSHASPDEHVVACLSSAYLFFFSAGKVAARGKHLRGRPAATGAAASDWGSLVRGGSSLWHGWITQSAGRPHAISAAVIGQLPSACARTYSAASAMWWAVLAGKAWLMQLSRAFVPPLGTSPQASSSVCSFAEGWTPCSVCPVAARCRAKRRQSYMASASNLPPTSVPTKTSRQRRACSSYLELWVRLMPLAPVCSARVAMITH